MELSSTPKAIKRVANYILTLFDIQVILVGTFTGVQGDIRCKVLAALSPVK